MGREGRRRTGRATRSDERGVALVELALVITVMLIILYGVVELAFMYRSATASNTASRAGVRLAAAAYPGTMDVASGGARTTAQANIADQIAASVVESLRQRNSTDTPTIMRIYQANATTGLPSNGDNFTTCGSNCFQYTWNGTTFARTSGSWSGPDVCGTQTDSIGVYVELRHASMTGIIRFDRTFGERSVMRLEPSATCTIS